MKEAQFWTVSRLDRINPVCGRLQSVVQRRVQTHPKEAKTREGLRCPDNPTLAKSNLGSRRQGEPSWRENKKDQADALDRARQPKWQNSEQRVQDLQNRKS